MNFISKRFIGNFRSPVLHMTQRSFNPTATRIMLFLIATGNLAILTSSAEINLRRFPPFPRDFKIGIASSAYQIEGAWNVSGKGVGIWDKYTHDTSNPFPIDRSSGDIACDSYNKYKEDIEIVNDIGFDHYRISLSWPRILPDGIGQDINQEGIQYYKNVLDELLARNIEPYVTLYHWDHPAVIEDMGGWMNESIIDHFANYASQVFKELGSRVKFWSTINEPIAYCLHGYGSGYIAPGLKIPKTGPYQCGHNMLKAHATVYRIYDRMFRKIQGGKIGIVNTCFNFYPLDEDDTESVDIAFQYNCGWLSHPIFSKTGNYPKIMMSRIAENSRLENLEGSRLPKLTHEWIEYIKGTSDYYGLNYYTSRMTQSIPKSDATGWFEDSGVRITENEDWSFDTASWLRIVPQGLGGILRKVKEEYGNPEVYILENGNINDGSMFDLQRIRYILSHMEQVFDAIHNGCNVKAYTIWSLLDSFEWVAGYVQPFGIVHVNHLHPNRTRTPRLSASWLKNLLRNRRPKIQSTKIHSR